MADAAGPRVLIVDDDHTIARLVMHVLRSLGFARPIHVTTGREGLEAIDEADIVLLDHQLPDANGLDVLELLLADPDMPVRRALRLVGRNLAEVSHSLQPGHPLTDRRV